jgi:hypothetical protein
MSHDRPSGRDTGQSRANTAPSHLPIRPSVGTFNLAPDGRFLLTESFGRGQMVAGRTIRAPWNHYRDGREGRADRPFRPKAGSSARNRGWADGPALPATFAGTWLLMMAAANAPHRRQGRRAPAEAGRGHTRKWVEANSWAKRQVA